MKKTLLILGLFLGVTNSYVHQALAMPMMDDEIEQIHEGIRTGLGRLDHFRGRDITLFAGKTGVGKSVLVNLAADKSMQVNPYGEFLLVNPENGLAIGGGPRSVTSFPQHLVGSDNAIYVDVAGFEDTNGTMTELQNVAFLRQVLISANSLNIMVVTDQEGISASASGRPFIKEVERILRFLPDDFLTYSMGFVINKVNAPAPNGFYDALIDRHLEDLEALAPPSGPQEAFIRGLFRVQAKFLFVPHAAAPGVFDFQHHRAQLRAFIQGVRKRALAEDQIRLDYTLSPTMRGDVMQLFDAHITNILLQTAAEPWRIRIERNELNTQDFSPEREAETKGTLWREVEEILQQSPSVQVLSGLVDGVYIDSLRDVRDNLYPQVFETLRYAASMREARAQKEESDRKIKELDAEIVASNKKLQKLERDVEEGKISIDEANQRSLLLKTDLDATRKEKEEVEKAAKKRAQWYRENPPRPVPNINEIVAQRKQRWWEPVAQFAGMVAVKAISSSCSVM